VIGSATLHGEAEIEPGEVATPGSQEICDVVLVRPVMAFDIQEGADGVL
jgi:hypothetical protein